MQIIPVPTPRVEYPTQTDLYEWLELSLKEHQLSNGDVLVLSSKIISYFQGMLIKLDEVEVSKDALEISERMNSHPGLVQIVLDEADEVIAERPWVLLTLKNGIYCANAGVDTSNVPEGYAITWPNDLERIVQEIHKQLLEGYQLKKIAVLIIDSVCIPARKGTIAVSLASSGIVPVQRLEGTKDLFGNILKYSSLNRVDSLATTANLVMGESTESCPIAIIKEAAIEFSSLNKKDEILISPSDDLYPIG